VRHRPGERDHYGWCAFVSERPPGDDSFRIDTDELVEGTLEVRTFYPRTALVDAI
jgi:hypothetical protein